MSESIMSAIFVVFNSCSLSELFDSCFSLNVFLPVLVDYFEEKYKF